MTQEDAAEFSRAVNLAQTNKPIAHAILKGLASKYPDNTLAVLWLAFTSPDLNEAEQAVRLAERQNPSDQNVMAARQWLQEEKLKAPTPAPTPARTAYTAPVLPPVPAIDFAPAPVATPAPAMVAAQSDPGYKVINHTASSEFKRPSEILNIGPEAQTKTAGSGWANPNNPDQPTLRDALVKTKVKRERKPITTLTILAGVLGVLVVGLIAWGIFYFVSNPSGLSDTAFEKAGLPVYSELEKMDLPQSYKDQLSPFLSDSSLAKSNVKIVQMDIYKIKLPNAAADFTKFYKSEMDKQGWNVQSMSMPNYTPDPYTAGIKGHSYIILGTLTPNKPVPELGTQLAPNQSLAMVLLFEQLQPTPNS